MLTAIIILIAVSLGGTGVVVWLQSGVTVRNGAFGEFRIGQTKAELFRQIRESERVSHLLLNDLGQMRVPNPNENSFSSGREEGTYSISTRRFSAQFKVRNDAIFEILPIVDESGFNIEARKLIGSDGRALLSIIHDLEAIDGSVNLEVLDGSFLWVDMSGISPDAMPSEVFSSDRWSFTRDGSRKNYQFFFHEDRLARLDYRWFIFELP